MDTLPYEILDAIVMIMPIESVLNFTSTCKEYQPYYNDKRLCERDFGHHRAEYKTLYNLPDDITVCIYKGRVDQVKYHIEYGDDDDSELHTSDIFAMIHSIPMLDLVKDLPSESYLYAVHCNSTLDYLYKRGVPIELHVEFLYKTVNICEYAIKTLKDRSISYLDWMKRHGVDMVGITWHDNIEVWKWLKSQEITITDESYNCAAERGNVETLEWLWNEGIRPIDEMAGVYASCKGKVNSIKWLIDHGVKPLKIWSTEAYLQQKWEALSYLQSLGFEPDSWR